MRRKKHQSEACLWKYGCKSPRGEGADILRQQMRETHHYRNALAALERQKREEFYALERELFPEYAAQQESVKSLETQLEELRTRWKRMNAANRRKTENALLKSQIEELKKQLKQERAVLRETREQVRSSEVLKSRQQEINQRHYDRVRQLREETPAFWGNTSFVDQAAQSMVSGPPPVFLPWKGEGFVGITFRTPITPEVLFSGKNTRAWLEPCRPGRNNAGRVKRTTLHIAVASGGRRTLKMASLPLYFHRDFPEGCEITNVRVFCRKVGQREDWWAVFMLRMPTLEKPDRAESGEAAIHFGWRRVPEGLLVATVVDTAGETDRLILPEEVLNSIKYSSSIRAIRGDLWNETISSLHAFLKAHKEVLPEAVAAAAKDIHQWERHGRLVHLINVWRENRFPGDEEMFTRLTRKGTLENRFQDAGWLHRDKHLWDIESGVLKKAIGKRKHLYREFAAALRRKYRDVFAVKLNLTEMQVTRPPEEPVDDALPRYVRNASIGAVGILQASLANALGKGWHVMDLVPTASVCHSCGESISPDGSVYHKCDNCGELLHVEENACRNILKIAQELKEVEAIG